MPKADTSITSKPYPKITQRPFGNLPDGQTVTAWELSNANGMKIEVLTFGVIVRKIEVPDQSGNLDDVVLGFDSLNEYLSSHPYFGVTAGRVAGRITQGKFELNGTTYQLPINDPPNHLHGGPGSIDIKNWNATPNPEKPDQASVVFSYLSPHGENGYPGNVTLEVTITLTNDNEFIYTTKAQCDASTPISLTHHSYFNLAGAGNGNVLNHQLQIPSDSYATCDKAMTLSGQFDQVTEANDFRTPKPIGSAIHEIWQKHGDLYWFGESGKLIHVATVQEPTTGRILKVQTTQTCLQTYFAVSLNNETIGKKNRPYPKYGGLCLECEGYPDAVNHPNIDSILVHPGNPQIHQTIYHFLTA